MFGQGLKYEKSECYIDTGLPVFAVPAVLLEKKERRNEDSIIHED